MPFRRKSPTAKDVDPLLRPSQREAIKVVARYLRDRPKGHGLVRMPTGAGKTGVMAYVAQLLCRRETVLIVAPFVPLVDQLTRHVTNAFWTRALKLPAAPPKVSVRLLVPKAADLLVSTAPQTYFCTTQTLAKLRRPENAALFEMLRAKDLVVLVDEGHREPAPRWAEAIRGVSSRVILFSATPYRNDNNVFDINAEYAYRRTFEQTLSEENSLRAPEFAGITARAPVAFAKELVSWRKRNARRLARGTRVIVRCRDLESVRQVTTALANLGERVVAVHDRGTSTGPVFNRVPDPSTQDVTYWVHQFKLLEGFDDPTCAVLAFLYTPQNHRSVVQQIGRVLRRTGRDDAVAYVLGHEPEALKTVWEQHKQYERYTLEKGIELTASTLLSFSAERAMPIAYLFGGFVAPRNASEPLELRELRVPKSVTVLQAAPASTKEIDEIDFVLLSTALEEELRSAQVELRAPTYVEDDLVVILYVKFAPSKFAVDHVWLDSRQELLVVERIGKYLFCASTSGGVPEAVRRYADPVDPSRLAALVPSGERVRDVVLQNTDLGRFAVRRRSVVAFDLADLAAGLGDHRYICSTAGGTIREDRDGTRFSSRYVGFMNARVRESGGSGLAFDDFRAWTARVASALASRRKPSNVLVRFARHRRGIRELEALPEHVLLDVPSDLLVQDREQDAEEVAVSRILPELAAPVNALREWEIKGLDGRVFSGTITFDVLRQRYEIDSEAFKQLPVKDERIGHQVLSLQGYLNSRQAFRVVASNDLVYAHGHFFESQIATAEGRQAVAEILDELVFEAAPLVSVREKGDNGTAKRRGWASGSIFGLLDADLHARKLFFKGLHPTHAVCDDLQDEIADFIVADANARVAILIHAKDARGTGGPAAKAMSVSALHDVTSQAAKNLALFAAEDAIDALRVKRWSGEWMGGKTGIVARRMRVCPKGESAEDFAALLRSLARNPATRKEVWIVVSRGLSRSALLGAIQPTKDGDREMRVQAMQAIMLLLTLSDAVGAVGARLRVWCRP